LTTFHLTPENENSRLDQYLTTTLKEFSRSQIQKLIRSGCVSVDGSIRKSGFKIIGGEKINVEIPHKDSFADNLIPENIPLDILYEDQEFVVLNKQSGLVVHPGAGIENGTLVNGLLYHFKSLSNNSGTMRPGIVHRLDKDTTGVILVAKTNKAHSYFGQQFEKRKVKKDYLGVTWGEWKEKTGSINEPISRKRSDPTAFTVTVNGKLSLTDFEVIDTTRYLSIVRFIPKTGRTHQIRVHSAHKGHPIFRDEKYNGGSNRMKGFMPEVSKKLSVLYKSIGRHALHAYKLSIRHPVTEEKLTFEAPIPDDLSLLIKNVKKLDV